MSGLWGSAALAHEGEVVDAGVPERTTVVRGARAVHTPSETIVAPDVVRAAPRAGATELLRLVPGLVASQHSGEGKAQQLFLRGFDAVHGQDVELNVAGLPVNEVSHLHALGYADLNWLVPEAVREVRVTEGSARAWQGDFAVAGTVRYELGLEEPGFTFAVGRGSFGRTRLFGGFRPRESETSFVAAEYVEGDGFGPQRAFHRFSALGQAVLSLERLKLRAVAGSYTAGFASPGVVRDDAWQSGAAGFFQAFGRSQGGAASRHQLLLGAEVSHGSARTSVEAFGLLLELRLRNNFTGFLRDAAGDGLEQTQQSGVLGARVTHVRHLHLGAQVLLLEAGASVRHDRIRQAQRGYDEADGRLREPVLDGAATRFREAIEVSLAQTMASAWAELAWAPGAWRLMLGGRVDVLHVSLHDALAFAGAGADRTSAGPRAGLKAGLERGLGEHVRLFLAYGDGFRSPQARQLSDGERAPFVAVHGGELGARFETSRVTASLLGFASWVQNDFFFDHSVGTTSFVGPTVRAGGQAALTARPVDELVLSLNLTAAQARLLEKDALLPYFAPLVGRLDASWRRSFGAWTPFIGVGATLIGPRPLPYDEFSRAVFLLDARVGSRLGPVELALDLQNALDARWRDGEFVYASKWDAGPTVSLLPARQFTAGAPRTVLFTLEVHL
ncbi:MAG: TonB-dependent receptor [Myxococcota bacterium]